MENRKRDIAAILKGAEELQGRKKAAKDGSSSTGSNGAGTAATNATVTGSNSTQATPATRAPVRPTTPPPRPAVPQISPLQKRVPPAIPQPRIVHMRPDGGAGATATSTRTHTAPTIPTHTNTTAINPVVSATTSASSSRHNTNATPLTDSIQQAKNNLARAAAAATANPVGPVTSRQKRIPSVLVNKNQRGNKVLDFIKDVPWEYGAGDMVADYVTGSTSCVLFLSIKYHSIKPEYIYRKIAKLQKQDFELKVLLVLIDKDNHEAAIRELTRASFRHELAVLVAWSNEDCGNYISKLKSLETATPKLIEGSKSLDYTTRLADVLNNVRLNKSDALHLTATFGSLKKAILDDTDKIAEISGFGPTKVKRWKETVMEPFIYKGEDMVEVEVEE